MPMFQNTFAGDGVVLPPYLAHKHDSRACTVDGLEGCESSILDGSKPFSTGCPLIHIGGSTGSETPSGRV